MDNDVINKVRESVDIVDVISKYVNLIPKGKNYFGVCPFHSDHSPSMSVSKEKQIYKCFSCGASGNVFNFIQDFEHVSFNEALKILGDMAGIPIDGVSVKTRNKDENKSLYDIYDISSKFYINNLNTNYGIEAKDYLHKRGITDDLIHEFDIGLSLNDRSFLTKLLVKKQFKYEDMIDSGLIVKNDYGYSDIYVNRIMFPLYDINGRIVGYSGRIYNKQDTSKYINTRETKIFKKGELLYNYHRAKDECRISNTVIITEGFMDVIRLHSVGIKNVVAAMGTAITKEHILLIRRLARNVILMFDGDSAGAKATESCINLLLEYNITPSVVRLPENLDPDEYILKYGKDSIISKLENPMNIMDFKLSYFKSNKDLTNTVDIASYVNEVISELKKQQDEVLRELSIRKLSEETKLDVEFLKDKVGALEKKVEKLEKKVEVHYNKYDRAQQGLLFYMMKSPDVIRMYDEKVTYMPNEMYRKLAYYISCFYKEYGEINVADLMTYLSEYDGMINVVGDIECMDFNDDFTESEINDYIFTIKECSVKNEMDRLRIELSEETDVKKKALIGMKIFELKKMEQEERYYD